MISFLIIVALFFLSPYLLFRYLKFYYTKKDIEYDRIQKEKDAKWLAEQSLLPKYKVRITFRNLYIQLDTEIFEPDCNWGNSSKEVAKKFCSDIFHMRYYHDKKSNTYYPSSDISKLTVLSEHE